MPSIVGNIKINSIGSSAVVSIGDTITISPKSTAKSFAGGGSFITGDYLKINNGPSATNTLNPHIADSNIAAT